VTSYHETSSWTGTRAADVRLPDVISYLMSKGWQQDGNWRDASVWRLGEQARLLVPDGREYDDSDQLIEEAVAKIARCEARPERDVWRDIAEPMIDAQFFRLHPDAPAGSIPLPAGVKATTGILALLKAAASVTEHGAPLLVDRRRSQRVDVFLHQVLLSSAAPGSYILTARVPAAPVGAQQLDIFDDAREFSGRAVTARLYAALDAAWSAAQRMIRDRSELDTFYTAAESGVSANLCRALADLGGEKRDRPFEIGFSWARGVPGQDPVPEISFTDAMPAVLSRAGEELEALARQGTASISGIITDLHDEPGDPARIKIRGDLRTPGQGRFPRRAIWIALSRDDYDTAIEAHQRGRYVQVTGELTTTGRLELTAHSFEVVPR
jgi:hypothetical protein